MAVPSRAKAKAAPKRVGASSNLYYVGVTHTFRGPKLKLDSAKVEMADAVRASQKQARSERNNFYAAHSRRLDNVRTLDTLGLDENGALEYALMLSRDESEGKMSFSSGSEGDVYLTPMHSAPGSSVGTGSPVSRRADWSPSSSYRPTTSVDEDLELAIALSLAEEDAREAP